MKNSKIESASIAIGSMITAGILAIAVTVVTAGTSSAQTKVTVGRTTSASGFHIPSYVAMDKGLFKREGLDAKYVAMGGR
ncbi:MAG: hypothetical protein ACE5I0_10750, partial [Candidatus Binatia bacterium]